MWTNDFAYPAGKEAGYNGGTSAYVGPGWQGKLPEGVKRIDSPTRWMLIQPRVHLYDEADLPNAQAVLKAITVKGLAEYMGQPPVKAPTYNYAVPKVKNPNCPSAPWTSKTRCNFGKSCRQP
jgi:DNA sulfur modification protein DndE